MPEDTEQRRKDIIARIESLEEAIEKAREYLDTGKHADWRGFRALFVQNVSGGKELPPHKDWVRNVYLPRQEKALNQAERLLERFSDA